MGGRQGDHDPGRARRRRRPAAALKPFGAAPPLVTDIDLSVDDRWLYVSCWGTGELKQYDVSDPFHPRETASVRLGGIVRREPHPAAPDLPLGGGPQMVEISRDGRRVYVTNSLYAAWDDVVLPRRRRGMDGQTRRRRLRRRSCPRCPILPARRRLPRPAGAPDPAPGRRRVQRLVLLHQLNVRQPRSMPVRRPLIGICPTIPPYRLALSRTE